MSITEEALLKTEALTKRFGGIVALDGVSLEVRSGEITGLIGPNGSGKTTTFNTLTGVLQPSGGHIIFRGHDISRSRPDRNAKLGMSRTFQNIRLFPELSVVENVAMGLHMRYGKGFWANLSALPGVAKAERGIHERAMNLLGFLGLTSRADEAVTSLPYGAQRKVELARALATEPKLLLLDEPSAGMNAQETQEISDAVRKIHEEQGVTVLLVEHDMKLVMQICDQIHVINHGRMLATGSPDVIQNDPEVIKAYLGTGSHDDA